PRYARGSRLRMIYPPEGGFVGHHSASDTESQWPWHGGLVGACFANHPPIEHATVLFADSGHASTTDLAGDVDAN
ncbi:MAG: ThuA domain-containing protein, partial [Alphaproteobacteria bacterium]|nr:ThuA domain-containing protein [Alphaproteobacteria bacterium]